MGIKKDIVEVMKLRTMDDAKKAELIRATECIIDELFEDEEKLNLDQEDFLDHLWDMEYPFILELLSSIMSLCEKVPYYNILKEPQNYWTLVLAKAIKQEIFNENNT